MTDNETVALLRRVDVARAELRQLEAAVTKECIAFGKRQGCPALYREHMVRRDLAHLMQAAA